MTECGCVYYDHDYVVSGPGTQINFIGIDWATKRHAYARRDCANCDGKGENKRCGKELRFEHGAGVYCHLVKGHSCPCGVPLRPEEPTLVREPPRPAPKPARLSLAEVERIAKEELWRLSGGNRDARVTVDKSRNSAMVHISLYGAESRRQAATTRTERYVFEAVIDAWRDVALELAKRLRRAP